MADFDLTQTDAQVQSILNDAQDAMGAGAQTTLTTDYVMLKDTNGRYHKILKDSLTEACRNVLADLLVNNDKGTTISQIAAIGSGDFGSVTPANLASVLGVWTSVGGELKFSANDITETNTKVYSLESAASNVKYQTGILIHFGTGRGYYPFFQVNYNSDGSKIAFRMKISNNWSAWKEVQLA